MTPPGPRRTLPPMSDPSLPQQALTAFTDREIAEAALREVTELAGRLGTPTRSMVEAGAQSQQDGTLMAGVVVIKAKIDQVGNIVQALLDVLGPTVMGQVLSRLSLDESTRRLESARRPARPALRGLRGGRGGGGANGGGANGGEVA